jgi:hypothetical protein
MSGDTADEADLHTPFGFPSVSRWQLTDASLLAFAASHGVAPHDDFGHFSQSEAVSFDFPDDIFPSEDTECYCESPPVAPVEGQVGRASTKQGQFTITD